MRTVELELGGALMLAFFSTSGCGSVPTQVLVRVDAEPGVRARARTLCVAIESENVPSQERCARVSGPSAPSSFPTTVPVLQEGSSPEFIIAFTVFDAAEAARLAMGEDAMPFLRHVTRARYTADEVTEVQVVLSDACIDRLDCMDGMSCVDGSCQEVVVVSEATMVD